MADLDGLRPPATGLAASNDTPISEDYLSGTLLRPAGLDDLADGDQPPPSPTTYPDVLPQTTEPWIVSEANPPTGFPVLRFNDPGHRLGWIAAPGMPYEWPITWNNPTPAYNLALRRYWQQIDSVALPAHQTYSRSQTYTTGTSTTDTESISAELGVGVDGLSAKLSATLSHSVTVTVESSVTQQWTVTALAEPQQFVLWQLIEEVVALTPSGQVLSWDSGEVTATIHFLLGHQEIGDVWLPTARMPNPQDFTFVTQGP